MVKKAGFWIMDEPGIAESDLVISETRDDVLYPMCFGISCVVFALDFISKQELDDQRWLEKRDKMLQRGAHLLGFLVWKWRREEASDRGKLGLISKFESAKREIEELKKRRREDAKGNEKVAGIYATKERCWLDERKKLHKQIGALLNELKVVRNKRDEAVSEIKRKDEFVAELDGKLQEMESLLKSKDKDFEEEKYKITELEEKLMTMARTVEELKGSVKRDAQAHSSQLWKHKAAFIELVSNQRQLEAQQGRALRQAEAAKKQLEFVLEENEESMMMAENLSNELDKMNKDLEQKDKILTVLLTKSKLDKEEKQMLLKEVKLSKAKQKQVGLDAMKATTVSGSRSGRRTLKSMLSRPVGSRLEVFPGEQAKNSVLIGLRNTRRTKSMGNNSILKYARTEIKIASGGYPTESNQSSPVENGEQSFPRESSVDAMRLEDWVSREAGKHQSVSDQRREVELEAVAEQMRLKDDKLEAYRWRMLSMELESKRLLAQIEGQNQGISELKHENVMLQTQLLERDEELMSLKWQLSSCLHSLNSLKTNPYKPVHELPSAGNVVWSNVTVIKKKLAEKEHDMDCLVEDDQQEIRTESALEGRYLAGRSSAEDCEDVKEVTLELRSVCGSPKDVEMVSTMDVSPEKCFDGKDRSRWRMDLHALGVSYKIKRLKQQFQMLERLTGKQDNGESMKGFHPLLALLIKQVSRYQSLYEKIDDLLKRMHEGEQYLVQREACSTRTKEETRVLGQFLEETFQLQRYVVATGQKLMEIQDKVGSTFVGTKEEGDGSTILDLSRFGDNIRTLLGEVQRGLEVRISQVIGNLEGTLARDGINSKK